MDYSYGKTQLNFVIDPTQNGEMTTILDFHYNTLYITYFRRHLLGGACILHIVRICTISVFSSMMTKTKIGVD